MRIVIFFDLPTLTEANRKEYRNFRKYLIKYGFLMMQESVYFKLVPNKNVGQAVINNIKKKKPSAGLVQALMVTENQYKNIEFICGDKKSDVIDTDEKLVIL